jgi:multidrug efflux pump
MTTAAMILGAIPLAIATGAGAESRQQIGWVIVGGMSLGTVLTLFVVPCVYAVMGWRPKGRVRCRCLRSRRRRSEESHLGPSPRRRPE